MPSSLTRSVIPRANVTQRRFGSVPFSRTRSWRDPGRCAHENVFSGQSMRRIPPSAIRTVGLVAWKSKNSSGSILANGCADDSRRSTRAAPLAASPASFQP
jgi:hypothetical protein